MDKLGLTATDTISGLTGVVTGFAAYITGCNQILISPKCKKDGTHVESFWMDEQRCSFGKVKRVVLNNGNTPGADRAPPTK